MPTPRIALIGLGMAITPHARSLMDLADIVDVACAFAPSASRRAEFAAAFPFPLTDSLDTILADRSIDAVLIATPLNTHAQMALACANAGKHVLLEKPLEITTERAAAMVEGCKAANVTLGVVLQHRMRPSALRAAELLAAGSLGEVVGCSTTIRLWRPQSYYDEPGRGSFMRDGGGVLMSQAIHTLDLMLALAGPVAQVKGFTTTTPVHTMETEDMVCAAVRYANGAIGVIDATTAAYPGFHEEIVLTGTRGTLCLRGSEMQAQFHSGEVERVENPIAAGGTGADPMAFPHDAHRAVIADFVQAVSSDGAPKVTGEGALSVHRLIDALIATGQGGGPVDVAV